MMNKYDGLIERIFVGNEYVGCNIKTGAYDSKEDMKTLQELVERATQLPSKEIIQSAITVLTILPVLENKVCLKALNDIIKLSNFLYGSE